MLHWGPALVSDFLNFDLQMTMGCYCYKYVMMF